MKETSEASKSGSALLRPPPPHYRCPPFPKEGSVLSLLSARERRGVVGRPPKRIATGTAEEEGDGDGGYRGVTTGGGVGRGLRSRLAPHRMKGLLRDVTVDDLASITAWNVRRMQNMILAVGPGTPASAVVVVPHSAGGGGSISSSEHTFDSEEEDDEEEGDHDILDTDEDGGGGVDVEIGHDGREEDDNEDEDEDEEGHRQGRRGERRQRWRAVEAAREGGVVSARMTRAAAMETVTAASLREEGAAARLRQSQEMVEETVQAIARALREGGNPAAAQEVREVITVGRLTGLQREDNREEEEKEEMKEGDDDGDDNGEDEEEGSSSSDGDEGGNDEEDGGDKSDKSGDDNSSGDEIAMEADRNSNGGEGEGEGEDDDSSTGQHPHRSTGLSAAARRALERRQGRRNVVMPSMRHGGCINTASWLDCPWRLSLASQCYHSNAFLQSSSHSSNNASSYGMASDQENEERGDRDAPQIPTAVPSIECPTQLMTSGDDRLVKFWDVSNAMGSTSPLPDGTATLLPFASTSSGSGVDVVRKWKARHREGFDLPGTVVPLATLHTGHRGNVFHVSPVPSRPGKILTCAADGFLRLADVEAQRVPAQGSSTSVGHSHRGSSSAVPPASVVIDPEFGGEYDDDDSALLPPGLLSLRSGMCFSHHLLDANTGLLCSERGLRRFDLRLSAREQSRRSILGGRYATCKSCAVWSACGSSVSAGGGGADGGLDSAYVFAGGSSGDVSLYDLRMTDSGTSSPRIVQHYRPRAFGPNESVSVSGIDVSRDKRELLVSYENDQIYTFPIFPHASSSAGPTVEDMASYGSTIPDDSSSDDEDEEEGGQDRVGGRHTAAIRSSRGGSWQQRKQKRQLLPELASYGGHLNRYTFLKMAKYAGPNDEYICTGSDSGHAWIYDRRTGSVASLLGADRSTCNGVVPHPTLPVFVTYGIDSTAKLWRATGPVDGEVDDSDRGRALSAHNAPYHKSPIVQSWKTVAIKLDALCDFDDDDEGEGEDRCLLPDEIPARDDNAEDRSLFGSSLGILFHSASRRGLPFLGNDLRHLPDVLRKNYYACVQSKRIGEDPPVRSGLVGFKRRVGLARLRYQADRMGLKTADTDAPWVLRRPREQIGGNIGSGDEKSKKSAHEALGGEKKKLAQQYSSVDYEHPSDLVPEHPSDWVPFDPDMVSGKSMESGMLFNLDYYADYFYANYGMRVDRSLSRMRLGECAVGDNQSHISMNDEAGKSEAESQVHDDEEMQEIGTGDQDVDNAKDETPKCEIEHSNCGFKASNSGHAQNRSTNSASRSWNILKQTIQTLKEGGNAALAAGNASLAAKRYDSALQYCSVAFMDFPEGRLDFLCANQVQILQNGGHTITWTPLLKLMITVRLNLSLTMLRPDIDDPTGASDQAHLALNELSPFVASKGKVMIGKKLDRAREGEPVGTYAEAKRMEAKAYFRLGSAQFASGDFEEAARSLERSIASTAEADDADESLGSSSKSRSKRDPLVARRLAEARREHAKKKRRQRKKFQFMFQTEDSVEEERNNKCNERKEKDEETDRD